MRVSSGGWGRRRPRCRRAAGSSGPSSREEDEAASEGASRSSCRRPGRSPILPAMRSRLARLSALTGALVLACAGEDAARARPDIVLVLVDTLRADRLPSYGYLQPTAPFLDELARRGALFERVIAPSSWTKTSRASFLTPPDPLR